jgi:antitoxin component YwqK of YwqJK toxin-antitoxin module
MTHTINHTDSNGLKQGYWEEHHSRKETSKGHYKDSLREGTWLTFKKDLLICNATYHKDLLEGPFTIYEILGDHTTLFIQGTYKADKREGLWKYWWIAGGKLRSQGYYKEDLAIGIWEYYHHSGALKTLIYKENNYPFYFIYFKIKCFFNSVYW